VPNLVCRIYIKGCRHKYRRTSKIWERWNSALLGWEAQRPSPGDMCYHVKFGSSATKVVCIDRKEPLKLGSAGTPLPWGGGLADHIKVPPRMCHHVKFGSSALKGVCINRREALEMCPFPTCYPAGFGRSRSNGIKETRLKIWPLASCLSRSLKVIVTDTTSIVLPPMTSY